jgi:hypothetical protein
MGCDPNWSRQCVDQRMQAATAGARGGDTPAGIRTAIRAAVDTAAASRAAVEAGGHPGLESGHSAVGIFLGPVWFGYGYDEPDVSLRAKTDVGMPRRLLSVPCAKLVTS